MITTTETMISLFHDFKGDAHRGIHIESVMTDTRVPGRKSLFIPIVGENFDAHSFLDKAIEQGAVAALWQKDIDLPAYVPTDFPVFFVEDTLTAMQRLANEYIRRVEPTVVAITGSNGKTTTKDMAASVLRKKFRTHYTKGNLNNHIGVPLTVFAMPENTEVLVLEMGMNRAGEIEVLSELARPHYGIVTNIGESHIEHLGSRENIATAKLEITAGFRESSLLIYDGDEKLLAGTKGITCGFSDYVDRKAENILLHDEGSRFQVEGSTYDLPLVGKHNVKNAVYVLTLAEKLGMNPEEVQSGFGELTMTGMRLEKVLGLQGSHVFNDTYNASPTSMKAVIDFLKQYQAKSHKILVLGDMFELGYHSRELHASVAESVTPDIDAVLSIGEDSRAITEEVARRFSSVLTAHYKEKQELIEKLKSLLQEDSVVLVKASRGMKLEEVVTAITNE
ncbi:UDP-N-acetylmuramoyl-tripeptide--D-alanyl-D-alanine ligase [Salimicrobium halophilum]|uniref:UDP-N-acetylmuramoyl-tripeptide--D-alanyl-D-alanine ligase n=1 Tax=Salimicrobium halophilum TaxID=86666 RepID=A0A1G8QG51_9BACI|nr:UDP-N-acetylmuramoyl-tripeptide--D-alanyl-D-alanine ligase [Salimicrobium halophilum]SDJ03618.1 UDP-N-acetylmuramoyl-tripeptide--D-alanyl-D-alanine ligase [Salimicrobium halophilum]